MFADKVINDEMLNLVLLTGVTLSIVGGVPDAKMPTSSNVLTGLSVVFVVFVSFVDVSFIVISSAGWIDKL